MSAPSRWAAAVVAAVPFAAAADDPERNAEVRELEELVVTADPLRSTSGEIIEPVGILTGAELAREAVAGLGETLAGVPGIHSTFFGQASSRPIIRGLRGSRVRTLANNVGTLDVAVTSDDHAVAVEPLFAERIEVLKGPATLAYGSAAIGGVVNVVDARIHRELPTEPWRLGVELRGDTVAEEETALFRTDARFGQTVLHFDYARRRAGDYDIPGFAEQFPDEPDAETGTLENSFVETDTGGLGYTWVGDRGWIGVSVSRLESRYGVPGHSHAHEHDHDHDHEHEHAFAALEPPALTAEEDEEIVSIDLEQTRYDLQGELNLAGAVERLGLALAFNDYEHTELEGAEVGTAFDNDAWEARVEAFHAFGIFEGVLGLQLEDRQFSALGDEAFVPPVDTRTSGLFLIERFERGAWSFDFGGRIERTEHEPTAGLADRSFTSANLSAAAAWRLSPSVRLRFNLDRAERAPAAEELYSDGPHLATDAFEIGDPSLGEETALAFDVGLDYRSGRLSGSIDVFRYEYDDFIYQAATGAVMDDLDVFLWTQGDARFTGAEAELGWRFVEGRSGVFEARVFGDLVRAELDAGGNLPRIPPARFGVGFEWRSAAWVMSLDVIRTLEQDRIAEFETTTDAFTMVDASLSRNLELGGTDVELFLIGRNLLDEEARRHTSFIKDLAPLPGRNLAFGARAWF